MSKEKMLHFELSSCMASASSVFTHTQDIPTRLVPLWSVHIDWSMSTRSPKVYGNAGPFDIEATADFKKSMLGDGFNAMSTSRSNDQGGLPQEARSGRGALLKWDVQYRGPVHSDLAAPQRRDPAEREI
jgi:hypothetical protein